MPLRAGKVGLGLDLDEGCQEVSDCAQGKGLSCVQGQGFSCSPDRVLVLS